ncbi:MAG TPA: N-acetyltransferase, partial [Firmicutes bacterium]|nr:N-acetyltransferase [Bacillota bacterium]
SLLMVHEAFRGMGYGKEIYDEIEDYSRKHNLKGIRIDVVCEYNGTVLQFWKNRGFKEIKGI